LSRDSRALEQLEAKRRKAVAQMDRLLADVTKLNHPRDGILAIGLNYPPELLDAIRARRPLPPDFHENSCLSTSFRSPGQRWINYSR